MSDISFLFELDEQQNIIKHVNENISSLLGYSAEDFINNTVSLQSIIHPDDVDILDTLFANSVSSASISRNIRLRKQDGKIKCVIASYKKIAITDSANLALTILLQSAVDLKQTVVNANIISNFTAMMENTDDYIYFKDRHHVFTGASQTLVDLTDPSEHWSDLIGLTDYDVFPEHLADQYYSLEKQVFTGKIKVAHEIQPTVDNQGNKGWVDNRKYPIRDDEGNIIGLFGIARDITSIKEAENNLLESQSQVSAFGKIIEDSLNEIFIFDASSFRFIHANQGALSNIGYTLAEFTKLTPVDIKPDYDIATFVELVRPLQDHSQQKIIFETIHQRKDGSTYPAEIHLQLSDYLGQAAFVAIVVNITRRKESEKQAQLSSRLFNEAHEGIIITDSHGIIIDVNPTFCEITGYGRDEVIGRNPNLLSSGMQDHNFYSKMWQQIKDKGYWQGEMWNRRKNGELYAEMLSVSALKDNDGYTMHYVGLFSDITMSKEQKERLELLAHYDPLTKLPNRILLADRFTQAIAHSKRTETLLAVCFLDLDNFKPVNDSYGHETGDKLLIEVAYRLTSTIRSEDTVSRLGGDEFILLLGETTTSTECVDVLDRIVKAVTIPYLIDGHSIEISASIGISLFPSDNNELDVLLRNADQAMYQAKQAGKNHYRFFDAVESSKVADKQSLLQEIKRALVNDELCLFYQPKVNMVTGDIIGFEALIRWQHPQKGLLPPNTFLPAIDATEVEVDLGDWVIEHALEQLSQWHDVEIDTHLSINIASYHLLEASFYDKLNAALARYPHVDSTHFQLEILESSVLSDLEMISQVITRCRNELGVSIALDDFGTGYSSLSHISKVPANTIKIDQSFVRDILEDPDDYSIIDGVIGLANTFNKELIAEGVETSDHGLMLILMGCHDAQGYAIAKPMPADNIVTWINQYKANPAWQSCGQEVLSEAEKHIHALKLMLGHWLENIENLLENNPDETPRNLNCHFSPWLKRLRKDQQFKDDWIDKLQQAHDVMHFISTDIVTQQQAGDFQLAKQNLSRLHLAFNKMTTILGQYEMS